MDTLLAYHTRLAASAAQIPYSKALEWIQQRDEGERRLWADKHRTSSWSLGRIVKHVFDAREMMWDTSMVPPPPAPPPRARPQRPMPSGGRPDPRGGEPRPPAGKPVGGGAKFADAMKDGRKLCRKWNQGCPGWENLIWECALRSQHAASVAWGCDCLRNLWILVLPAPGSVQIHARGASCTRATWRYGVAGRAA